MKRIYFLFMVCIALLLSACGQKGPLYLPESTKSSVSK
ncbi:lipoprotein [Fluoribacter gormanii]|nr:lipoprotein [Fluoribacter gormanii]MCW8442471.1 lipoprotein [Fluoribacter gormanii]MCW8470958.1 lipoprotein [Fluoribacter gormanii]